MSGAGWFSFLGPAGLVLFVFGMLGALIARSFIQPLVLMHLCLGLGCLVSWCLRRSARRLRAPAAAGGGRAVLPLYAEALYSLSFVGCLLCLNWLARRYEVRWDLTEAGVHSLAPQSVALIKELPQKLKLTAIDIPGSFRKGQAEKLFELYRFANPEKVATAFADPRVNPQYVEQELKMKPGNLLYIQYGEGETQKVARLNRIDEETVTNVLVRMVKGRPRKVYYVLGHEEPDITGQADEDLSELVGALGDENLKVVGMLLAEKPEIPEDAAAVMLVCPKKELLASEKDALERYVRRGGGLLMLYDPLTAGAIPEIAGRFGITVGSRVVLDQVRRAHGAAEAGWQVVAGEYGRHPITGSFTVKDLTAFMIAADLSVRADAPKDGVLTTLVQSGPRSWAESNLKLLFGKDSRAMLDPGEDSAGPIALAAAYEKSLEPAASSTPADAAVSGVRSKAERVVVCGDSDWVKNVNINLYANRDLILNTMNWLAGDEGAISRRAASMRQSLAMVPEGGFLLVLAGSFLVPELILLAGLAVWWRRRMERA